MFWVVGGSDAGVVVLCCHPGLFVVLSMEWLFWAVCGSVAGLMFLGCLWFCRWVNVFRLLVVSPCENGEEHYSDRYVHDHQTGYDKKQRGRNPVTAGPVTKGYKRLEGM